MDAKIFYKKTACVPERGSRQLFGCRFLDTQGVSPSVMARISRMVWVWSKRRTLCFMPSL